MGTYLFFRRIKFEGIDNLPLDRPVIIVANHQNAMLDPLMVCLASKNQLHWLTRADIFRKPSMNWLLRKVNMLPVYRERDRVADLANKNQETFDECYARMKRNAVICIFPEGTHRGKKQLVPLKKGTARMVMGAIDAGIDNLCIVPVGLDYENYYNYRKNLFVKCGQPILINHEPNQTGFDRARAQTDITNKIHDALSAVMINITDDEVYHEIMHLRPLCDSISPSKRLSDQFQFFKNVSARLEKETAHHHFLKQEVNEYHSLMHQLEIREDLFKESLPPFIALFAILAIPIAALAGLFFYPLYALTEKFVAKVVKDPLFRNSIRLCFWTFLTPIWLLLVYALISIFTCSSFIALLTIASLFASGVIALWWRNAWSEFQMHLKCLRYEKSKNTKFANWKLKRNSIIQLINQLK